MDGLTTFLFVLFAITIGGLLVEGLRRIHDRQDILTVRLDMVVRRLDAFTTRLDGINSGVDRLAAPQRKILEDIERRAKRRAREAAATEAQP